MKKLKFLAILIFFLGLFCFLFSAYMFFTLESQLQLWGNLQRAGMEGAQSISLSNLRSGIITSAIWYAIIGLLSLVSGVGLFLVKNWARQLWLGTLILIAGIHICWLVSEYQRDILDVGSFTGYFIVGILIVAMWLFLNKKQTKNLFRGA